MYVSLLLLFGAPLHKVTLTYSKRFSKQGLVKKGRFSASPVISSCFNLLGMLFWCSLYQVAILPRSQEILLQTLKEPCSAVCDFWYHIGVRWVDHYFLAINLSLVSFLSKGLSIFLHRLYQRVYQLGPIPLGNLRKVLTSLKRRTETSFWLSSVLRI